MISDTCSIVTMVETLYTIQTELTALTRSQTGKTHGKYVADEYGGPVCFKKSARCNSDHDSNDCWETKSGKQMSTSVMTIFNVASCFLPLLGGKCGDVAQMLFLIYLYVFFGRAIKTVDLMYCTITWNMARYPARSYQTSSEKGETVCVCVRV